MNDILVLKNVKKKYKETAVVKDLSLNIKKG